MALNKVMLIGNVGNDPEVRYLESNPQNPSANAKVASFRLATTERFRDRNGELRENTEWHNIVVWRNNADVVEKFVHKGSQVYIEGKLRTRQWTDQTGNKRYTTEVVADNLQLLGKRPDGDQQQSGGYQSQPGGYQQAGGYQPQPSGYQGGYQHPGGSQAQPGGYQQQPAYQGGYPAAPQGGYSAPTPASAPAAAAPAPVAAPSSAPGPAPAPAQPQVSPDYQGPMPAAEPSDDLPF
jgi:single-strand DNA-binding protein